MNSVPKPGTQLIGSQKITVRTEVFVGQGLRWARGVLSHNAQSHPHPANGLLKGWGGEGPGATATGVGARGHDACFFLGGGVRRPEVVGLLSDWLASVHHRRGSGTDA